MKIRNTDEALRLFEECSIKQAHATEVGDNKTGNKNFGIIMECIVFLHNLGLLSLLHDFLSHPNVGVRMSSAYALLPIEREKAETVLSEIANGRIDIHRGTAYWTLKEWRDGSLTFPYQEGFGKRNKRELCL